MAAGDVDLAVKLGTEAKELKAGVAPHWESVETDISEADYFASLSRDEKIAYLADWEVVAQMDETEEKDSKGNPVFGIRITVVHRDFTESPKAA
jgi:hypothetical protein